MGEWGLLWQPRDLFYFTINRCKQANGLSILESSLIYTKLTNSWRVPRTFHGSPVLHFWQWGDLSGRAGMDTVIDSHLLTT